jgi:hypothetical protein
MSSMSVEPKPITSYPTTIVTGVNQTVPDSANYIVNVVASVDDVVIAVNSSRSHRIINGGTKRIIVDPVVAANVTVEVGQAVDVMWDATAHRTFLFGGTVGGGTNYTSYATLTHTAHGLTLVGQALFGHEAYDDTNVNHIQTGVGVSYTTNAIVFAKAGDTMTIPAARMMGGYSIATNGRLMYWDQSATQWVDRIDNRSDTDPTQTPGIMVLGANGSDWDVLVMPTGVLP